MASTPLLRRNLRALMLVGLSPVPNSKHPILNKIHHYYGLFLFWFFVVFTFSQFVEMYFIWGNFEEMTNNAGVSLLYAVGVSKVYVLIFRKEEVKSLVSRISNRELGLMKNRKEDIKKIMDSYVERNWSVTKKFWMLTFLTIWGFFAIPQLEYKIRGPQQIRLPNGMLTADFKKPLVFSSWFPFNKYISPYYDIAYGYQILCGSVASIFLAFWDTFICGLIIYAIGQLQLLQYHLRNLGEVKEDERELRAYLIQCVRLHNHVIMYCKDLDDLTNKVMFFDFVICSIMFCAIGFQVTLLGISFKLFFVIEYLVAMVIQLFMFYWHANELMLESINVSWAVWDSDWLSCSISIKRMLHIIIHRSQKPITLTVGKFNSMSLQTFMLILRASYSYLALLRQMYIRAGRV